MSKAEAEPDRAAALPRSRRRFPWWKALALCLIVLSIAGVAVFVERKPVAALLVQAYLLKYGVTSSVEFDQLDRGGFVAHVRVGPQTPEFSAEVLDVTLDYDGFLALPHIGTVRLVHPVLRASFDGKRLSFGSLQPLVDEALAKQPEGPGPSVTVEGGTLYIATPAGLLQLAVDASVDKGKLNRLSAAVSPVQLRDPRFTAEIKEARVVATVIREKLNGAGNFRIGKLSYSGSPDVESGDLEANFDIAGAEWRNAGNVLDMVATSASLAIKSASVNSSPNAFDEPEIKIAMENPRAHANDNDFDIASPRVLAELRLGRFQRPEISAKSSDAHLTLESVQAHFSGRRTNLVAEHANIALLAGTFRSPQTNAGNSEIRLAIDALKTSYENGAFHAAARVKAAAQFRAINSGAHSISALSFNATTGDTQWEWSQQDWSVAGPLQAAFDAQMLRYQLERDAITLTSLHGAFAGSPQKSGTSLTGAFRGSLTANATMPRRLANALSTDVPVAGADPKLAEAFANALAGFKLEMPAIDILRTADSASVRISKPISLSAANGGRAEISSLSDRPILHFANDTFDGGFNAGAQGGGLPEVALQVSSYRVNGRGRGMAFDASAALQSKFDYGPFKGVRISTNLTAARRNDVLTVALQRCGDLSVASYGSGALNQVSNAEAQICADAATPLLQADNAGWSLAAIWSRARGKLDQVQSTIDAADGRVMFSGDTNGVKSGRLEVSSALLTDAQTAARYRPVSVAGAMNLSQQKWSGTLQLTAHQRKLAAVQVRHTMDDGAGSAIIEASDINFDPMFQPADISPLLASLGTRVRGHASFSGNAAWNTKTIESSGTLHIADVDVQTPLGMARGVRGDLALTSLMPVALAPSQTINVNRIDWPVPAEQISARFSMMTENIQLEAISGSIAGGKVSLDPMTYSFTPGVTTLGTLRLEHIDLTPLIAAAGVADKVKITSRVGGVIPFTMGPDGLRFANGHITAESPGRLSIQRAALTSAAGTGANGQAQPNAVQDFAYQALENLSFTELNGDVNSRPMGRLGILFHVKGEHDPAVPMETRVGVVELLQGRAFDKPLPLPKGTPIDLTLDTSLNLDELLASYFGNEPRTNAAAK